jgi:hypothetical protein
MRCNDFKRTGDIRLMCVAGIFCGLLLVCGCGEAAKTMLRRQETPRTRQMTDSELDRKMDVFARDFAEELKNTMNQSLAGQSDSRVARASMMWRMRVTQTLYDMVDQDTAVASLTDMWAFVVRLREFLDQGEGRTAFAAGHDALVATVKKGEADVEAVARSYWVDADYEKVRKGVHDFARANPIQGPFSRLTLYATEVKPGKEGQFLTIVGIPLAPFRAMEGVDRGAAAIESLSANVKVFSDMSEELPESARWQLMLLLDDLEDSNMTRTLLANTTKFAESSDKLATAADKMPSEFRKEATALLKDVEASQPQLQRTTQDVGTTAKSVQGAMTAWEGAAKATTDLTKQFSGPADGKNSEPAGRPFDILDYRDTMESVAKAAAGVHVVTQDLQTLAQSEDAAKRLDSASTKMTAMIAEIKGLTNGIFWRIGGLMVLGFALALGYRALAPKKGKDA